MLTTWRKPTVVVARGQRIILIFMGKKADTGLTGTASRHVGIDPPFNSKRDYEVFWGEAKEKRAFDDRHASTQAYLDAPEWPRCVELARVLKKTGSFYYL